MSRNPDCQVNPAMARRINVETTAMLADLAASIDFIFFSTDLVFDGRKGGYVETDAVNPLSVYAETKVEAEARVSANPRHIIVRTSVTGGVTPFSRNAFNQDLRRAWAQGKTPELFRDEYRCPLSATVTARAVWELAARRVSGIFHLAGGERLSRLQIGELLAARHPELNPRLNACSLREYSGAPRPPDCSLNLEKIHSVLSFRIPGFTEWLRDNPQADF
jgi:dTDP-4-dehydrorhamnose reductase